VARDALTDAMRGAAGLLRRCAPDPRAKQDCTVARKAAGAGRVTRIACHLPDSGAVPF